MDCYSRRVILVYVQLQNDGFIHCYAHLKSFIWSDLLFLINIVLERNSIFTRYFFYMCFVNGSVCIVVRVYVLWCVYECVLWCEYIVYACVLGMGRVL